jgi:hypothetical protein
VKGVEITVVCAITRHASRLAESHAELAGVLAATGRSAEFVYVLDGPREAAEAALVGIRDERFPIRVFRMARGFGEATALQVGFEQARGRYVLTVADRPQIDPAVAAEVLERLDEGEEVVVTRRYPRTDPWLNRLQNRIYHALVYRAARQRFHDLTCCLRGFTRTAAVKLDLYGDLHRFIPVIAARNGHRVVELAGPQHASNRGLRLRGPRDYAVRILDILNLYFLARFTRRPLRFFGLIGLLVGSVGFVITAWLGVQRLAGLSALADRPLLLLGVLLIVLGVQVTAIGLLGEIIIFFATKRDMPEVREVGAGPAVREARSGAGGGPATLSARSGGDAR